MFPIMFIIYVTVYNILMFIYLIYIYIWESVDVYLCTQKFRLVYSVIILDIRILNYTYFQNLAVGQHLLILHGIMKHENSKIYNELMQVMHKVAPHLSECRGHICRGT